MRLFLQSFLLISLLGLRANAAFHLKSGDLILESLSCKLCSQIEAEEKSPYSHIGVLVFDHGNWTVLESWGKVRTSTLTDFLSRRKKETHALVLRLNPNVNSVQMSADLMLSRFDNQFKGLSYDSEFLWNNVDANGEKLYCSEFVAKFMQFFITVPILTKPMHFEVNREVWLKYFHGNPPDGAPGLSPGDFERSPLFHRVGTI